MVDEVAQDGRVVAGIVTLDEDTACLMEDSGAKTADGSSDHGGSARLRLDGDEPEGFGI